MKYKVRLMGFDLDGTLFTTKKEFTDRTKEALTEASERGIEVLPVTGRPLCGLPRELREFPPMRYAVTSNGARIIDMKEGRELRTRLVPVEVAEKVFHIFEKYDTLIEIYYDGVGYAEQAKVAQIERYVSSPPMAEYVRTTRLTVEDLWEKFQTEHRALDKVHGVFANEAERQNAIKELKSVADIEVSGAMGNNLEVNAGGVNKGEAILWLAKRLGIPEEETMGFGDGGNDLEMIRQTGIGVAMKNGREDLKEMAKAVTAYTNDEDGVAEFIETYVL